MRYLTIFICAWVFWICKNAFGQNTVRYLQESNGVEYFVSGAGIQPSGMIFHESVFRGHSTNVIKKINGELIYNVTYKVSRSGFRQSDASIQPKKEKHFFLIGGSIAFGEGLKDNETITHWLNTTSSNVETYPLGFLGHGPQHTWIKFSKKYLPKVVPQKEGSAIIIAHEEESGKLLGKVSHLSYVARFPILRKINNEYTIEGSFKTHGDFIQKMIINFCLPFLTCKRLLPFFSRPPSQSDILELLNVFTSIEKMYREQFHVKNVYLLWVGEEKWIEFINKNSKFKVLTIKYDKFDISHPNSNGAKQIAESLLKNKDLSF
jgi:hypothetical protein